MSGGVTPRLRWVLVWSLFLSAAAAADDAREAPREVVTVRLTGRNIADHWSSLSATVIARAREQGVENEFIREVEVGERTSLCAVYLAEAGLPGCPLSVQELAKSLNPEGLSRDKLVKVPGLKLEEITWGKKFDTADADEERQLKDARARWGRVKEFEPYSKGDVVRESFPGYRFALSLSPKGAMVLETSFYDAQVPLGNLERAPSGGVPLYSEVDAPRHYSACRNGGAPVGERGAYSLMLGAPTRQPKCAGNDCPIVVLVDTEIYAHPGLAPALLTAGRSSPEATPLPPGKCEYVDFERQIHHGSMLAGIAVGRDVPANHFCGIAQDASLYGIVWQQNADQLAMDIDRLATRDPVTAEHPLVWVFASLFNYNDRDLVGGVLADDNIRLTKPAAARAIVDEQVLWVTAIGQKEDGGPRRTIARTTPLSPMNLGDRGNVIVVTACDPCTGPDPQLWSSAYEAEPDLVHVAAPGGQLVPGIATTTAYAEARGTSQAAAFAGGLAAAMIADYPKYYERADNVKRRIQVTADPIIHPGDRIATGVINPRLALCDPHYDWFAPTSGTRPAGSPCGEGMAQLAGVEWCTSSLDLDKLDDSGLGELDLIRTNHVHRIVRVSPFDDHDRWVIYEYDRDHRDDNGIKTKARIVKQGPAIPKPGEEPFAARLTFKDGAKQLVHLTDIADLLLADVTAKRASSPCGL
jgi:Subtilase family